MFARISPEPHARSLPNFLCMLPMSVAWSSSSMLMIGHIAYQREGGDGNVQRGWSVVYDCLVEIGQCLPILQLIMLGSFLVMHCKRNSCPVPWYYVAYGCERMVWRTFQGWRCSSSCWTRKAFVVSERSWVLITCRATITERCTAPTTWSGLSAVRPCPDIIPSARARWVRTEIWRPLLTPSSSMLHSVVTIRGVCLSPAT